MNPLLILAAAAGALVGAALIADAHDPEAAQWHAFLSGHAELHS